MFKDRFGSDQRRAKDENSEIRVTDRRRIQLDENQETDSNVDVQPASLKPRYVEELEARTKAAEEKVQEVNARFEQLRKQLQTETDETRQRLNRLPMNAHTARRLILSPGSCLCSTILMRANEGGGLGSATRTISPKACGRLLRVS